MARYGRWVEQTHDRGPFDGYEDLWRWSVEENRVFWSDLLDYFDVAYQGDPEPVLTGERMPDVSWFPELELNYVDRVFAQASESRPALIVCTEDREPREVSWEVLRKRVEGLASSFRDWGLSSGDRVAAILPNGPEVVVGFLAAASLGAIWSSCSPDFGQGSIVDRFDQIEPSVLITVDGYRYKGTDYDRADVVRSVAEEITSLERLVHVQGTGATSSVEGPVPVTPWEEAVADPEPLDPRPVPFDHPLWILYSSGTTGPPKPIVQGHGGILLEHLKVLGLHHDLEPGEDRFFWYTTTGWMMWNYLIGSLLLGVPAVLYDGAPNHPDHLGLWRLIEDAGITVFGTSAPFLVDAMERDVDLTGLDLSGLTSVGSTGAPLPPEAFAWCYEALGEDLWLVSASGGTDLCTAFVLGTPLKPVHAGELQCRGLGADVDSFDDEGRSLIGEQRAGELVIKQPMPSMPLSFWNDPGDRRYRESYFQTYEGVWRHGDWIKITDRGSAVIYGRSDATINRKGVRIGTSELYRALTGLESVQDSLAVGITQDGTTYLVLLVQPAEGEQLDEELRRSISEQIRSRLTPRHEPDFLAAIPEVPRTLSGKKLELPVRKILQGQPLDEAANPDSTENPEALREIVRRRSDLFESWGLKC